MIWFVLFVPTFVVLGFVACQCVWPMEYWIAFYTVIALAAVAVRRRVGPKTILATTVTFSAIILYRMAQ